MKKSILISVILLIILSVWTTTASAASASVGISTSSVIIGNTVKVTVNFGQKVTMAQFKLNYDTNKFKFVSKTTGNPFSEKTQQFLYNSADGETPDESKVTFTFQAKSIGNSNFNVRNFSISTNGTNKIQENDFNKSVTIKEEAKPEPKPDPTPDPKPENNTTTGGNTSGGNNTTSKDPTFKSANQKVYVKSEVNVRSSWTTSSSKLGTLAKGDSVTRIGIGSNGWDKVSYQGKTGYILTSYLTTTEPKKEDNKNTTNNTVSNETTNNTDNSQTNNETNNEVIDNNNEQANQETSVTPEQKNNPNYVLYVVGGVIGLAIVVIIIASIVEKRKSSK